MPMDRRGILVGAIVSMSAACFLAVVMCCGLSATLIVKNTPKSDLSRPADRPPAPQAPQALKMSARELCLEYRRNGAAARNKYSGKLVEISGEFVFVNAENFAPIYAERSEDVFVTCDFRTSPDLARLRTLRKDQRVRVSGIVSDSDFGAILEHCFLESP